MKVLSLNELAKHSQAKSEFYKELYKNIKGEITGIEDLPLTNQSEFWKNNKIKFNKVLTQNVDDAIIFKSGGTTGSPKFSVYSRQEWDSFTYFFGQGMSHFAIANGDRVANLFYAGDLYSSFLFIHGSLEKSKVATVNFPISGTVEPKHLAELIREHSINVLAGVPTTLLNFAESFRQLKVSLPSVKKIIFGGESLFSDQREFLNSVFPGVKIVSIGYASVDGGLLGFADGTCEPEEHRSFDEATIMEIIDDNGQAIDDIDKPGELYLTNLTRSLMPIIRYPAGDRAVWKEPKGHKNRKYKLLGRSEEAARVGPVSVYFDDVKRVLSEFKDSIGLQGFQMILTHESGKDQLTVRVAVTKFLSENTELILKRLFQERPMLAELTEKNFINRTRIEFVSFDKLEINQRTGKLKRVLDTRLSV